MREIRIPLTEAEIQAARVSNNVPDNYTAIRTVDGGVVFVDVTRNPATADAYTSGQRGTNGFAESADLPGTFLRMLPNIGYQYEQIDDIIETVPRVEPTTVLNRPTTAPSVTQLATVKIIIAPIATAEQEKILKYEFSVVPRNIEVNLSDPIINAAYEYLQTAFDTYVDEDRTLKTLLNYGEDRQTIALNYRYGDFDSNNINKIQLKLLKPLPDEVGVGSTVFLSREVAKTLIDKVRVRFAPPLDVTPYLRPKNTKITDGVSTGKSLTNITLQQLQLISGSVGTIDSYKNKTFEDEIFRKWYSYDFNSSELNINFSDYSNFVFYSSAAMRLAAFKEKLANLERIEQKRNQFLSSSTYTVSTNLAGAVFVQEKTAQYAKEKEDIIRGFDRYEQYLYFTPSGSSSPYSASAFYVDGGTEYNPIGYWPKNISGSVYSTYDPIATEWFDSQSIIAQRFDEFNENNLINTIPTHVREHDDNSSYITFVSMVGHFFDTIKPYIDQFPEVYSRNLNPNTELSKDLVNEIAESIGFVLPTINSVYSLTDNILGTDEITPRRDLTAEIYKRILHNLPFYAKAKGTKTSLSSFIKTFGITPQLLTVKETGTPTENSYYVFDEYSTGLNITDSKISYIKLPVSSSDRSPSTLQLNLSSNKLSTMTVLTGDDKWALNIQQHPSSSDLARLEVLSGSSNTLILSSSYYPLYTGDLFNVALQQYQQTMSLYLSQTDGEDLLFNQLVKETSKFASLWQGTQYVYIGGSGSLVTDSFDGTIDEIRLWSNVLSDETILNSAFDPASNAGDTYTSAAEKLLVQLSFNNITTSSLTSTTIINESPYVSKSFSPSLETITHFNVSGSDFSRYNRDIRQDMIVGGSVGYITNKVKVAEDPIFFDGNLPYKRLYRTQSIVQPETKKRKSGKNRVIVAVSPTEIINQNIIRNFGYENFNAAIGSPLATYGLFEQSLDRLKAYYQQYYYVDVNFNRFVRIMAEVGSIINQVVDYFIPSRASLLKGILIEQNLLDQVRIPPVKNIRFYGKNSRKTLNAVGSLSSSAPDYGATFNVSKNINVLPDTKSQNSTYKDQNILPATASLVANTNKYTSTINRSVGTESSYNTYNIKHETMILDGIQKPSSIDIGLDVLNKVGYDDKNLGKEGAEPYHRVYTRKLFKSEIETPRESGVTSLYIPALYDIPPSADFRDFGVYTFFNNDQGIYYFPEIIKTPTYPRDLNQTWNFNTQQFNSVPTWSYGTTYNIYDVVYQNITADSLDNIKDLDRRLVNAGNDRYYVFKTRPSYRSPQDGTAFYSGSVPSYTPPSLDKDNWEPLRFTPIQKLVPKRVVFDTFRGISPQLNNFKTTTVSINRRIDVPDRYIDFFQISSIDPFSYTTGEILLQNISALFALQFNTAGLRIRLYRTFEKADQDLNRPVEVLPTGDHGVLLDLTVTENNSLEIINPITTLVADSSPPGGKIFYTINNLESTSKLGLTVLMYYFAIQIEPRIPKGYLRKHYRFFRDNSTATKRRNYDGCKNTQSTTIDGLPPVQVFLSEGTDLLISPTQTNNEIITGGGGTLNVT